MGRYQPCYALRETERAQPKAYWMNTGGNDMVRKLINKSTNGTVQMEIEQLIAGETIHKMLDENLTHNEMDANIENIWSLLYMTDYLTVADYPENGWYTLRIPNKEVRQIYTQQVLSWLRDKTQAETGKGRCNIIVERKDRKPGFVVEVKDVKDENKLDTACENTMKQIEEKDYTAILRR